MEHLAIDLGGRESQICVRSSDGEILELRRCRTLALKDYLRERPPSRVIVETCAEAFAVADAAKELGHEVRVVPSTLARTLGVGARRTKTDRRDSEVLSEVSCRIDLPSVHIPSKRSREWKTICGMRDTQVSARTKLINSVRGWLRGQGIRIRTGATKTFALRVREMEQVPEYVDSQLQVIELLSEQIAAANKRIQMLADEDETCRRLMTVPGVGPITALRYLATLDEIGRFADAHKVESYAGLVPGENSSSDRKQRTSITKAGSSALRWTLVQAAWAVRTRCRLSEALPLKRWALEVEKRRGKRIATVALARKLAGILYAVWRDGTKFDPSRCCQARS